MPTPDEILTNEQIQEIEARANAATDGPWAVWDSNSWRRIGTADPFRDGNVLCPITQRDGHPDLAATREDLEFVAHARTDIPALCATVKQLQEERDGILKNMIEMNQIRALDKTAWRRVGETLGLAEEESSHTSHVLATLAGRVTKYEQLQSQLEQLRAENEKLKIERDRAKEDVRILTNGRFIQS